MEPSLLVRYSSDQSYFRRSETRWLNFLQWYILQH